MTDNSLHLVRPFGWGLLQLNDRGAAGPALGTPDDYGVASATRSELAVNVHHASDVDAAGEQAVVTIAVVVGPPPAEALDYCNELDIATGVVEIGDAERVDELRVDPGTYSVAMRVSPADHPQHVELWIQRVGGTEGGT